MWAYKPQKSRTIQHTGRKKIAKKRKRKELQKIQNLKQMKEISHNKSNQSPERMVHKSLKKDGSPDTKPSDQMLQSPLI